jgi:cold shock CspA family protein
MRVQGQIKKILVNEGFGFIETKVGMSVFFHKSQSMDFNSLKNGTVVEFEVKETQKGKSALYVRKVEVAKITQAKKGMLFSRGGNPKQTQIVRSDSVTTSMFRNPNLAKDELESIAKNAGCNAVLNMDCKRETLLLARNYYGTVHTYTADIAILSEEVTINPNEQNALQFEAFSELTRRENLAEAAKQKREESKYKGDSSVFGKAVLLIIAFIFLFIIIGSM